MYTCEDQYPEYTTTLLSMFPIYALLRTPSTSVSIRHLYTLSIGTGIINTLYYALYPEWKIASYSSILYLLTYLAYIFVDVLFHDYYIGKEKIERFKEPDGDHSQLNSKLKVYSLASTLFIIIKWAYFLLSCYFISEGLPFMFTLIPPLITLLGCIALARFKIHVNLMRQTKSLMYTQNRYTFILPFISVIICTILTPTVELCEYGKYVQNLSLWYTSLAYIIYTVGCCITYLHAPYKNKAPYYLKHDTVFGKLFPVVICE